MEKKVYILCAFLCIIMLFLLIIYTRSITSTCVFNVNAINIYTILMHYLPHKNDYMCQKLVNLCKESLAKRCNSSMLLNAIKFESGYWQRTDIHIHRNIHMRDSRHTADVFQTKN